jgi:hypothetical protein
MTISAPLKIRDAQPVQVDLLGIELQTETTEDRATKARAHLSTAELAFRIFAAFRAHPHISNVLTHISHSNWPQVEHALNVILDPAGREHLSPLAENIVDLMCAERGITGKILKPYFHGALERLVEPQRAERLIRHISALFVEIERKAKNPPAASVEPVEGRLP